MLPAALVVGTLAGLASFAFLEALDAVTRWRTQTGGLIWLLPVAGIVIGTSHQRLTRSESGRRAVAGTATVMESLHDPDVAVPRRTAPVVAAGSLAAHLFGASVGREGVALQLAGSLATTVARWSGRHRPSGPVLTTLAVAGGFGSVFGVPLAGCIFAIEVASARRVRHHLLLPALTASVIGDGMVRLLGHEHAVRLPVELPLDASTLLASGVAGIVFAGVSVIFVESVDLVRSASGRIAPMWLRPGLGGVATLGLVALVGRDQLGLSLPLLDQALGGDPGSWVDPLLKILFTAVAIGSGFPGGEVTPLFVIGATTGAAFAGTLGLPVAASAALGMAAVFAAAASTPLACIVLAVEIFGSGILLPVAVACTVAFTLGEHRGIYPAPTRPAP